MTTPTLWVRLIGLGLVTVFIISAGTIWLLWLFGILD